MDPAKAAKLFSPEFLAEDQSERLIHVVIIFAILEVLFVSLFLFSRYKFGTLKGFDVYLMVPAFIASYAHLALCIVFVKKGGLGKHTVSLSPERLKYFLKLELTLALLNPPAITLPKLAILCLYLRVFSTKIYRYGAFFIGAMLIVAWIVSFILQMAMCSPFEKLWDKSLPGKCLNEFQIFIWFGIPHIVTDVAIIILPLPLIWRLQTTTNQKIGLTLTFLTGSVGIITSIIRFAVFLKLADPELDLSWTGLDVVMWTTIEPGVYLIAACLPSLRPLLNPFFRDLGEFDFRGIRGRFRNNKVEDGNFNGNFNGNFKNIRLSGVSIGDRQGKILASSNSPRSGFTRLDKAWPKNFTNNGSNNDAPLTTCFRESVTEDDERLDHNKTPTHSEHNLNPIDFSTGIVVQKAFTISTEPVRR
ncbi:uncharacterized protein BP5553_09431 [Venustampulla echinocandica]|uniref:Rhodopsin domain-containing protein n=1 Tax=Venustampulla echinocandica TaxID=2656787 RepID=A0A370TCP2_9HELO|nr:uncharacterized protein BP5553_09431 [Venustampulla echinocandica]RDL32029.1 hypothetical protein BP5553_09431 [Venustampulla echinocandica]